MLESREDVLRIPSSVITSDGMVYVYDAGSKLLEERQIEVGIANWEYTEVLGGLQPGDLLVSSIDREGVTDGAMAEPE